MSAGITYLNFSPGFTIHGGKKEPPIPLNPNSTSGSGSIDENSLISSMLTVKEFLSRIKSLYGSIVGARLYDSIRSP